MEKDGESSVKGQMSSGVCYVKARHVLTMMAFLARFNMNSTRSGLSVAIVAMVNHTDDEHVEGNSSQVCPDRGINKAESLSDAEFNWTIAQQGMALGCYYYGYLMANIPGGILVKKYGIRLVLGISMLLSSIVTLLSPLAASTNFYLFIIARIWTGMFHGPVLPSIQAAWGIWAPPQELTKMLAISAAGDSLGILLTFPLAGLVAERLGWEAVFYVTGAVNFLWSIWWIVIIFDTPGQHPRISHEERLYIEKTAGVTAKREKLRIPWRAIASSIPMWAIVAGQSANNWGYFILLALLPTYVSTVLRFDLTASGILSALPYILQFLVTLFMGFLSDTVRRRHIAGTMTVRRANSFMCLVLGSIFIVGAGYSGCDIVAATSFFCIATALMGCNATSHEANVVDIAPRFSGLVYAIVNAISNVPGFLAPQVAGLILRHDQSVSQWRKVFWMAAGINAVGFLIFCAFGSATEQSWSLESRKSSDNLYSVAIKDSKEDEKNSLVS